jgi:hypothetical protein
MLHEIIEAPTRTDAKRALERFREEFGAKYPKAVAKLDYDWKPLTAFYDFPGEHWRHLRTTDESVKGGRLISRSAVLVVERGWLREGVARWQGCRRNPVRIGSWHGCGRAGASSRRDVVCVRGLSVGATLSRGRGRPRSEAQVLGLRPAAQLAPLRAY